MDVNTLGIKYEAKETLITTNVVVMGVGTNTKSIGHSHCCDKIKMDE